MKSITIPEYISLNIPFIFILLIIALSLIISYYFYKKTTPEIKNPVRYLLLILRAAVFTLLFLLLFSPKLSLTFMKEIKPKTAVYVDNSASMGSGGRIEKVKTLLESLKPALNDQNIDWFAFNTSVSPLNNDSIRAEGYETNFNTVFKNAEKNEYSKIMIISDGNNTESDNFSAPSMPVIALGIGKISGGSDIYIADVKYNPIARLKKDETIEVVIGNKNNQIDKKISIKLLRGKKLLKSKIIQDITAGTEQSINFNYTPLKTGLSRFTVVMDTLPDEENVKNNRRTFVQKIISKNRSIGLFVGIPDYDSKFISLLLSGIDEFDVYKYTDKITYGNASEQRLDSLDVLIFSNFPGPFTRPQTLDKLKNIITRKHPGVIIKQGEKTDFNKLRLFDKILPFKSMPKKITVTEYSVINSTDPLLILYTDSFLNDKFWQKIPPVNLKYHLQEFKSGSKNILYGLNGISKVPLINTYAKGRFRSVYFSGDGYWRWYFTLTPYADIESGYQKLLTNLVYWASNAAKLQRISIDTENGKRVFKLGEKIRLNINLYDADFEPITNGNIELGIMWNKQSFNVDVTNDSMGIYTAEFYPPGDGKYQLNVHGFSGGAEVGKAKLSLEVVPVEKEFLSASQNAAFLKTLAQSSGGLYFDQSVNPDTLKKAMRVKSFNKIDEQNVELWYKPVIVILIILIITLEWIIRRKYRLL